jgi:hypothetical protein
MPGIDARQTMNNERKGISWGECLGLVALAGLAVFFVATSWRKWPDILIDFSRELYVPWRLANGALLYRDVDEIFGPLSQYLNAGLFALFGPGLMVLVAANLAVFAAILTLVYLLFRRAWGVGAALAAGAVFVSVFGFSEFITIGNYNYATPYCHETTHGMLVCLLLVAVLFRWVEEATPLRSFLAGGLFGLTAVLKPEIMLAGGAVTLAAMAIRHRQRKGWSLRGGAAWAAGAILPTALFAAYFSTRVPFKAAVMMACRAWLNIASTAGYTNELVQSRFLGFDHPGQHAIGHAIATLLALLLIACLGWVARLADRTVLPWLRLLLGGLLAGGMLGLAWYKIAWFDIGHCLLGLTLIYAVYSAVRVAVRPASPANFPVQVLRLLIAVLAAAMMVRMLLAGRIFHYGFYQAALAGVLVPAVMIGELPGLLGLGRWGRGLLVTGSLLLLAPGVVLLAERSQRLLRQKTYAIGQGRDLFYTFPPEMNPTGEMVRMVTEWLAKTPRGQTLVVLPEGAIINYLARMPGSVMPYAFFGGTISNGREPAVVDELKRHPPDWIVIISRDLNDYGIRSYGERTGAGLKILLWVAANYEHAMYAGGNPFDPRQCGAMIMRRK